MTTNMESTTQENAGRNINWQLLMKDNVTGSWYQTIAMFFLTILTVNYAVKQFAVLPASTLIIVGLLLVGIASVVIGELRAKHNSLSRWLKENLISSLSNILLTLLIMLLLVSVVNSAWQWGVVNASFDPEATSPQVRPENGATWGVIWGARKLLMTGLFKPEHTPRAWMALAFILGMWFLTYVTSRPAVKERASLIRGILNGFWLLSPIILYILLAGVPLAPYNISAVLTGAAVLLGLYFILVSQKVINFSPKSLIITLLAWPLFYSIWWGIGQSGQFTPINVDTWGGLLLTLIIASSVILLSLPLGMALALGRRSEVFGIPSWITWPLAIAAAIWGFTTTPELLATSRNFFEQVTSFWPVLILVAAYLIDRGFKGNIVAGASTTFIELVRSVPLITLLFMGIIMAPFFFEVGTSIAKPWPVIVGYTIFSSAYMAETIRGGLQAIPKGQYEASDALGMNGMQKMRFIILPQALRIVIPAIVGQFIGAFKSSSLVSIVGLFDFLGINRAIIANPEYLGLRIELYAFMALFYFIGSFLMSSYSRKLEVQLGVGER